MGQIEEMLRSACIAPHASFKSILTSFLIRQPLLSRFSHLHSLPHFLSSRTHCILFGKSLTEAFLLQVLDRMMAEYEAKACGSNRST